jgi:hypothetical protein
MIYEIHMTGNIIMNFDPNSHEINVHSPAHGAHGPHGAGTMATSSYFRLSPERRESKKIYA